MAGPVPRMEDSMRLAAPAITTLEGRPVCPSHPDREAKGTCARCGRFVCASCEGPDGLCDSCVGLVATAVPPATGRAAWATRLLGIHLGVDLVSAASGIFSLGAGSGDSGEFGLRDAIDGVVGVTSLAVLVATAVAFLRWEHLAVRNLQAQGKDVGVTPGWAVGWWFVPIANLWKPFQVMRAIVQRIGGEALVAAAGVGTWWGLWIASNIASQIQTRISFSTGLEGEIPQAAYAVGVVASLLSAAAAWQCRRVVQQAQSNLDRRRE